MAAEAATAVGRAGDLAAVKLARAKELNEWASVESANGRRESGVRRTYVESGREWQRVAESGKEWQRVTASECVRRVGAGKRARGQERP